MILRKKPVVLILAGGESSRFWPLRDKNLTPMMGKTLLQRQLEEIQHLGFKNVVVVGNKPVLDWSKKYTVNAKFIIQDSKYNGMAGAVLSFAKIYQNMYKDKPLYICNANDFYENQLHQLILREACSQKADVYIASFRTDKHLPMGYLTVKNNRIAGIIEKPPPGKEPSDLVNIVAHWYNQPQTLFRALTMPGVNKKITDDLYEIAMAGLMKKYNFRAVEYQGKWRWLKYPWDLLGVMDFFLGKIKGAKIAKTAQISAKSVIKGPVVIEEGVKVYEGAVISGPAYIGQNTVIGSNALVRRSVVGCNGEIGFCTEIARSYVGDNCRLHSNYVGDSVLAAEVDMGAGAVTANFRLDEQNIHSPVKGVKTNSRLGKLGTIVGQKSKIGVNASIMPGVKIGAGCTVGPNVVLTRDLPSGKAVLIDQKLSITANKYRPITDQKAVF